MDKYVCGECFEDECVKNFIAGNAVSRRCSFCDRESDEENCAHISDVAQFIQDGLESEFDYAVNCLPFESREGGYQGVTYETYELLTGYAELGFENEALLQDLLELLPDDLWCDHDPFRLPPDEELRFDWGRFSELVKHEMRYVFYQVEKKQEDNADIYEEAPRYEVLSEIGELLRDLGLSRVFAAGTVFYRARLDNSQRYSELADLGPPAKEYAKYANRFSPAGIPMFYGALDMETTIAEVYDCPRKPARVASIAKFEAARTLHLLHFADLTPCPGMFNGQSRYERAPLRFLHTFVRECTRTIAKDGREHIDYVPTQVITEFFRHIMVDGDGHRIDGLLYPSAKRPGGTCCVVFCTDKDCTENHQPLKSWEGERKATLSLDKEATTYRQLP